MITYKMHLIRGGSVHTGEDRRYTGQSDPPLSGEGREELGLLSRRFAYPRAELAFTSPLLRCRQTCEILFPELFVVEADALTDMSLGEFEGHTYEELREDPGFQDWLRDSVRNPPPGGEEVLAFQRRIFGGVSHIFSRMMKERIQSAAVVTHGGVIMSLLAGIGLPKRPVHDWAVGAGAGYTLLFTPQMWMRDGCAEIYRAIPEPAREEESDGFDDETV